jgi:hypothetical protein
MAGRKPGTPKTGGRRKGSVNKTTAAVKDALATVYQNIGGDKTLASWAKDNQKDFYTLWVKLLPVQTQISGPNGGPIETANLSPEQREQRVLDLLTAAKKRKSA